MRWVGPGMVLVEQRMLGDAQNAACGVSNTLLMQSELKFISAKASWMKAWQTLTSTTNI